MDLLLRKLYLYFTKDPEGVHYFPWVGVQHFQGGGPMLISIETHITCYFLGGGGPEPLSPSGSVHRQCHHNGTIFFTAPLINIIVMN